MDLKIVKIEFVENIDWTKLWWIVTILTTFWALMAGATVLFPGFETWYKLINIILGALSGALLFAARGGKYVRDRSESPPPGGQV